MATSPGLWVMAIMYVLTGVLHFVKPAVYQSIMPPYLPAHRQLVWISGVAEIGLGIALLFPQTRSVAAWGIILLLIAVFPANVYMASADKFRRIPAWLRWLRLPLQAVLIWWALHYT